MTTLDILHNVRSDLESADSLLSGFYAPWDADDTRPLHMLKDALDAQQRALVAMLEAIQREQRINAGARGRLNSTEMEVR